MKKLTEWIARRSGGRITITGKDETGSIIKVPNIDKIEFARPAPIATDKDGSSYALAV